MRQQRKNKIDVRDGDEGILSLLLWMYGIYNTKRIHIIAFPFVEYACGLAAVLWDETLVQRHCLPADFLRSETALLLCLR
jgi:hypothetical protein